MGLRAAALGCHDGLEYGRETRVDLFGNREVYESSWREPIKT